MEILLVVRDLLEAGPRHHSLKRIPGREEPVRVCS
jgi:hypothetical protein